MPDWLKWLNPKQVLVSFLRDEIDRQIENRTEVYHRRIEELEHWNETTKKRVYEITELKIEEATSKAGLSMSDIPWVLREK